MAIILNLYVDTLQQGGRFSIITLISNEGMTQINGVIAHGQISRLRIATSVLPKISR